MAEQAAREPAHDGASRVQLSRPAELVQKLSELKESDPVQFKRVVSDIAASFQQQAASSSGQQNAALSDLADAFSSAAESGDLSAIQQREPQRAAPPPPPPQRVDDLEGIRGAEAYRRAAAPPPPPPAAAIDSAFANAIQRVDNVSASASV